MITLQLSSSSETLAMTSLQRSAPSTSGAKKSIPASAALPRDRSTPSERISTEEGSHL